MSTVNYSTNYPISCKLLELPPEVEAALVESVSNGQEYKLIIRGSDDELAYLCTPESKKYLLRQVHTSNSMHIVKSSKNGTLDIEDCVSSILELVSDFPPPPPPPQQQQQQKQQQSTNFDTEGMIVDSGTSGSDLNTNVISIDMTKYVVTSECGKLMALLALDKRGEYLGPLCDLQEMANNKSGTKNWYKIKLPDLTHTLSFNDSQLAQFLTHNLVFLDPYDQSYRKLNSAFVYEVLQLVFASCIEYDWDISALDIGAVVDELCTNHYVDLVTSFLPSLVGCGMREFVGSLVSKSGHPTSNTDQDVAVINQVFLKPVVYSFVHCIFSKFGTSGNSGKSKNCFAMDAQKIFYFYAEHLLDATTPTKVYSPFEFISKLSSLIPPMLLQEFERLRRPKNKHNSSIGEDAEAMDTDTDMDTGTNNVKEMGPVSTFTLPTFLYGLMYYEDSNGNSGTQDNHPINTNTSSNTNTIGTSSGMAPRLIRLFPHELGTHATQRLDALFDIQLVWHIDVLVAYLADLNPDFANRDVIIHWVSKYCSANKNKSKRVVYN